MTAAPVVITRRHQHHHSVPTTTSGGSVKVVAVDSVQSKAQAQAQTEEIPQPQEQEIKKDSEAQEERPNFGDDILYLSLTQDGEELQQFAEREYASVKQADLMIGERLRLKRQHNLLTALTGGLVLAPIKEEAFNPPSGSSSDAPSFSVLDAGTGSAIWLEEFGKTYPGCDLWGCDLSEYTPVRGSVGDELGINYFKQDLTQPFPKEMENKFDLVNVKLAMIWIRMKLWDQVLENIRKVLKPGGWIQIVDPLLEFNFPTREGSQLQRVLRIWNRIWFESATPPSTSRQTSLLPTSLHSVPGYLPSSISHRTVPISTGARAIEYLKTATIPAPFTRGEVKELAEEQMESVIRVFMNRCFHTEREEVDWLLKTEPIYCEGWRSGLDGVGERLPRDEGEWEELVADAMEEMASEGNQYDMYVVIAQKEQQEE